MIQRQTSLWGGGSQSWGLCMLAGVLGLWTSSVWGAEPAVAPQRSAPKSTTSQEHVLKDYLQRADDHYRWEIRRRGEIDGAKYVELLLTSQKWRGITWQHRLFVLDPSDGQVDSSQALLLVSGGDWQDQFQQPAESSEPLPADVQNFAPLTRRMRSTIAILYHVPFQPIFGGMVEDEIISYTFQNYLESGENDWPLLLPMVKSVVRGMDAVTEVAEQEWRRPVKTFTVTGASKRGWTTWLTGAVEPRATAIAPMVIDVLDMDRQMEHQKAVWGDVSTEINDYKQRGLTEKLDSARGDQLRRLVDPYHYREQLQQPKLLIMGTNDQYWPIDALNLYWHDLHGPKHVMYVPNQGHSIKDLPRLTGSLNALHQHAARGFELAEQKWNYESQSGLTKLVVRTNQRPQRAVVWAAESDNQDFRSQEWKEVPLQARGEDRYEHQQRAQGKRFTALFGELVYDCGGIPYFLSTNVRVIDWQAKP